jgi:hypothetical protein
MIFQTQARIGIHSLALFLANVPKALPALHISGLSISNKENNVYNICTRLTHPVPSVLKLFTAVIY